MEAVLGDHDLSLADVAYLMITHLDHDHMGQNALFRGIPTIVQRREVEHSRSTHDADTIALYDFPGAKIEQIDGDVEILPGVKAVWTPGHTPGHQSVVIEDDGETTLIVGDAAYTSGIWEHPEDFTPQHPGFLMQIRTDPDLWRESLGKLRALDADTIHFCHDTHVEHAH
jgi:N-acyl homoserine lactone hydrolase